MGPDETIRLVIAGAAVLGSREAIPAVIKYSWRAWKARRLETKRAAVEAQKEVQEQKKLEAEVRIREVTGRHQVVLTAVDVLHDELKQAREKIMALEAENKELVNENRNLQDWLAQKEQEQEDKINRAVNGAVDRLRQEFDHKLRTLGGQRR
jgi:chromosome segregation ATPase